MMAHLRLLGRSLLLLLWLSASLLLAGALKLLQVLTRQPAEHLRQRLSRLCLNWLVRCLPMRVQVHGQLPGQTALWLSNHVSWCDIPLLGALQPLTFLSKAEVRAWPLAGWLAAQADTLFIQRGAGDSNDIGAQIGQQLQEDRALLLFPEGTTTDGQSLRTFHGRLLSGVIEQQRAVQPVAIRYWRDGAVDLQAAFIGDDDLLSHLRRLLSAPAAEVEIHLLPLLLPLPEENRNQLARRAQHCVADCLERLRAPNAEPQASALTS